ncbi:MAG: hypothetical protein CEN90_74 [Parcubacteria group bacterium Licking1014_17]|nr:MAG: hypothetical protein CEN90_74 [Parcubacteria group bacterium Licking1014_17]
MPGGSNLRIYIIGVAVFIIGLSIGFGVGRSGRGVGTSGEPLKQSAAPTAISLANGDNYMLIKDQAAGSKVTVTDLKVQDNTWVAIYEDYNGKPRYIYGARLFAAGEQHGIDVKLIKPTVPSATYYAMFHVDNGDRAFDWQQDKVITDDAGKNLIFTFHTTSAPASGSI